MVLNCDVFRVTPYQSVRRDEANYRTDSLLVEAVDEISWHDQLTTFTDLDLLAFSVAISASVAIAMFT